MGDGDRVSEEPVRLCKNQHYYNNTVHRQASLLTKVITERESHKQREKDEIVQDDDFSGYSTDSKSTSGGMLKIFGEHTFAQHFMGMQETDGSCHTAAQRLR